MAAFDSSFDAGFDVGAPAETGSVVVPISLLVGDSVAVVVPLHVAVGSRESITCPILVDVVSAGLVSGAETVADRGLVAAIWGPVVTLGGSDITNQVVGEIVVEGEEGVARVADFTIRPESGSVIQVNAWTGKAVRIAVADMSTGVPLHALPLFVGVVDTPSIDVITGSVSLRCTDDLQGRLAGMTKAQVAALVGGRYSTAVFDPAANSWQHAQDRLSTRPASLDISPAGQLRVADWAAKAVADLTFDDDQLGDGSVTPEPASRASMINRIDIDFGYRFPRVKAEGYALTYSYVDMTNFAQYLSDGKWFLQREAVLNAISSTGGTVQSISWIPLPDEIIPWGTTGLFIPGPADAELCMGFTVLVAFDYAQEIDETHKIAVEAPASIEAVGVMRKSMSGALVGEYPPPEALETAIMAFKSGLSSIPPRDAAVAEAGLTTASEVTLTDDTNRAAAEAAMAVLIDIAKTEIWASHRGTSVHGTVPLNPAVDLDKTIAIDSARVSAKGKCRRVVHRMNPETGEAVSEFALAICSVAGVGAPHPEDETTAPAGTTPASTALSGTPLVVFNSGPTEDHAITITFPGVEDAERARASPVLTSAYRAPLVEDDFTITL